LECNNTMTAEIPLHVIASDRRGGAAE
jgi:hypothetical protein